MANGKKPDYNVCISQRKEDKSPSKCLQIGAAWVGDKGQLNVKIEEDRDFVAAGIKAGYDIVLFEKTDEF
jgi:hypothetical protein